MKAFEWLLTAFLASGMDKIVVKLASAHDKFLFMTISYSIACVFVFFMKRRFGKKGKLYSKKSFLLGFLIGLVNFFAFLLLLTSLSRGPASIVFPVVALNTVVVIILSVFIYRERLTKKSFAGIVCSLLAILLLK